MTNINIPLIQTNRILFNKENQFWCESAEYNFTYLKSTLRYLQGLLETRGFLFVNDLRRQYGFPMTPDGQVSGWTSPLSFDVTFEPTEPGSPDIWVTFSPQGVIVNDI